MSENDFECFAKTGPNAPGTMFPDPRMRGVCLVATLFLANWKFAAGYVLDRLWRSAEERVGSEGFEILSFVGRVLYPPTRRLHITNRSRE
jgi:hypothetical protein